MAVLEISVLEDYFHFLSCFMGHVNNCANFVAHVPPISAEHLADVRYHIEFFASVRECLPRLGDFTRGGKGSVREADCRACLHAAAGDVRSNRPISHPFSLSPSLRFPFGSGAASLIKMCTPFPDGETSA